MCPTTALFQCWQTFQCLADGMTEEELAEELSELEQALSALEGEAVGGASPGGFSPGGSVLDRQLAEKLGLADDDGSDPAGEWVGGVGG